MNTNTEKLRALMKTHRKNCKEVGEILGRSKMTVRIWRSSTTRHIPDHMLQLLELKLAAEA